MKKQKKYMLYYLPMIMVVAGMFFTGCSTEDAELPSVETGEVTNISYDSATSGGAITDEGGSIITAMGVVWDTTENPTVSDHYTSDGEYTIDGVMEREFSSHLTELDLGTKYYVRAYASNEDGVAYGDTKTFETEATGVVYHDLTPDMIEAWTQETLEGPYENLVDGDPSTYWHSAWSSDVEPLPHWIKITFDGQESISGFDYTFRQPSGITDRPNHFDFQISDDGDNWTTVWESETDLPVEPVDAVQTLEFGETFSSVYFRVRILDTYGSRDWTHLSTIEVFEIIE